MGGLDLEHWGAPDMGETLFQNGLGKIWGEKGRHKFADPILPRIQPTISNPLQRKSH